MGKQQRILVVDEPPIARALRRSLGGSSYEVKVTSDCGKALVMFGSWAPDLVITDLTMPSMGGLELCRRLRTISPVPIIVLSSINEERAKVEALDLGADDYLTKPVSIDELRARVRAALRRPELSTESVTKRIEAGDFQINLDTRSVSVCGHEIRLTPKEYDLLTYLIRHPGKVLTRQALLSAIWGRDRMDQATYLRVLVGNLRKKIEPDPTHPCYLVTEPWVGYRFEAGR